MAEILSTSYINTLVSSYQSSQKSKLVTPLETRKNKYTTQSSTYGNLIAKLTSLQTELKAMNATDSTNVFKYKLASSSNSGFVSATASTSSLIGSYDLRVNQLAKKDIAVSSAFTSDTANAITGLHKFKIVTGDGEGGSYTSNIEVEFEAGETNETAIQKIQEAINTDKAVVNSSYKTGTTAYSGGASSFTINLNGTEKVISIDESATNYSEVLDSLVSQINENVDGVLAEKVEDPLNAGSYRLSLTVQNSSNYISISTTSGFDLVSDLAIGVTKEKGASGIVTASSFSATTGNSQLSVTAKESGLDYRIKELSDESGYTALSSFGLNFGTSRSTFNQSGNVAGFLYSDITSDNNLLNAKFTFNGISVQRNSNVVNDIADGLTLNLKGVMSASDTTVNVGVTNDFETVKTKVQNFITKFNDIYTYIKSNNRYTDGVRGSLYGDANSSALLSRLSSMAYTKVADNELGSLAAVGISFDPTNGLSISNSDLFKTRLDESPDDLAALFNSEEGLTSQLETYVAPLLGSSGYLTTQQTSFNNSANAINDRIEAAQSRIEKSADYLRYKYQQLQTQYASLLNNQSFFSSES